MFSCQNQKENVTFMIIFSYLFERGVSNAKQINRHDLYIQLFLLLSLFTKHQNG